MAKQCDMCFQFKDPLVPVLPKMPTSICKACSYKVGQVTGFLQYHKVVLSYQPQLSLENPPDPPSTADERPSKRKLRAKAAKDTP